MSTIDAHPQSSVTGSITEPRAGTQGHSWPQGLPAGAVWASLTGAACSLVCLISRGGDVVWSNAETNGSWFPTPERGQRPADPLVAFVQQQPQLLAAVSARQSRRFRGVWRGLGVLATVTPMWDAETSGGFDGSLLVIGPSVFAGAAHGASEGPILSDDAGLSTLTANELEVLALLGQGLKSKEIAHALSRSEKTIEARRSALGRKLGVETRGELVRIAIRTGVSRL